MGTRAIPLSQWWVGKAHGAVGTCGSSPSAHCLQALVPAHHSPHPPPTQPPTQQALTAPPLPHSLGQPVRARASLHCPILVLRLRILSIPEWAGRPPRSWHLQAFSLSHARSFFLKLVSHMRTLARPGVARCSARQSPWALSGLASGLSKSERSWFHLRAGTVKEVGDPRSLREQVASEMADRKRGWEGRQWAQSPAWPGALGALGGGGACGGRERVRGWPVHLEPDRG